MDNNATAFLRLVKIMDELREKCPWDQKQTIHTLRSMTIEELYELVDAIDANDWQGIKEELGDLFLHLLFYSKIGSEQNQFSLEEVLNGIAEKLIRRHPHIYGDIKVQDEEEVKRNWQKIKQAEGKADKSILEGVPKSLPAIVKATRIQEKARQIGFEWENKEDVWKKVDEEIGELKVAEKQGEKEAIELEFGDKEEISFRVARVEFEEPYLDDSKPIYFSAYGDKTKKFGYYQYENGKTSKLIFEDLQVNRLAKALDANVFSYIKQDYDLSPELYISENFTKEQKAATTNPQQQNYYWGKSKLVSFTNKSGKKMQGALYYPANYEPGKQYPMIVYMYEILSNNVHNYVAPSIRRAYNTTNYTTNGYFVFQPDIVYETNDPGMSAVNCIVPGVKEVMKTGMIDANKVGIMGHSWGAYQTSFLITQTDIFKAAIAGASLTDLISMSLSIYWNSGTPDQKIFETSQGRFDGPWYERTEAHIRNSPMFNASKIKAPLLVTFGDKDGAVDWHQGIEMYGTMRRMEKPFVMLVYADENHNFTKKENQIDYQKRQREWFDHYLLGKPAEKWITDGVSYIDRMKEKEKEAPKN